MHHAHHNSVGHQLALQQEHAHNTTGNCPITCWAGSCTCGADLLRYILLLIRVMFTASANRRSCNDPIRNCQWVHLLVNPGLQSWGPLSQVLCREQQQQQQQEKNVLEETPISFVQYPMCSAMLSLIAAFTNTGIPFSLQSI